MLRKSLALTAAVVLAASGVAVASARTSQDVPSNALVRVIKGAPECGGQGFTKVTVPLSARGFICVHDVSNANDAYDTRAASYAKAMGIRPATKSVTCYGDGTTGPRVQMIYGYYDGMPNRAAQVIAQFRTQLAPRMQAVISNQSNGQDLGLRFVWTKGCGAIDVKVIKFPRSVQYATNPSDPGGQIGRAANTLISLGYNRSDRKYQILWDGWNGPACGIGEVIPLDPVTSTPYNPTADGFHSVGGHTDPGVEADDPVGLVSKYSMIFNHAGGQHGPSCFNTQGMSTVTPEIHELFHTLGAVQLDAPHANQTAHCDDAPSVMCPGQGPGYGQGISNPSCARVIVETLDCGEDDYWAPNPVVGSYLATHHNIAKSPYFGMQPEDYLAAAPI